MIESYVPLLRRKLDEAFGGGRSLLVTEHRGYSLAAGRLAVDVDECESLLREAAATSPSSP